MSASASSPFSLLSGHHSVPSHAETVLEPLDDMPVYDPNDDGLVPPIIIELVKTFFQHLGCSHPFLREERTLRLVKDKKIESILVDAMCALAARFVAPDALPSPEEGARSEYGNVFAQRAKAAIVDTFPCPSLGSVQAYLLMAYEGFGANQDSALWMYLGLAIRMALDMGLHKTEGVQYLGDKDPWYTRSWHGLNAGGEDEGSPTAEEKKLDSNEQQEIVQERTDTAWAVYILDRVISTGTGRTVTMRDDEFELPIPEPRMDPSTGLPAPYPIFIHIIQLYGRVSDVLNKLRRVEDLTADRMASLAKIESELTGLHQKQDPRLHFNPLHFQNYVKKGQGTLFILLHVWFHACVIIIHQPLLTPFGSRRHQLTPTSRELAMSSAKTIADILAFAELIDPMAYIGNPFTSQPMYIAACAFLTASSSQPVSRAPSPPPGKQNGGPSFNNASGKANSAAEKPSKHSLLADAANQNYQRCYKSLQQLHDYWGGVKYILNALDHRSKGRWDCETYTPEEYASIRLPRRPAALPDFPRPDNPSSPQQNVRPIVLSLTGTTNSPKTSLGLLFPNKNASSQSTPAPPPPPAPVSAPTPPGNMIFDPVRQSRIPESTAPFSPAFPQPNVSAIRYSMDPSNPNRMASSIPTLNSANARGASKFDSFVHGDVEPGTPGDEHRLHFLSSLASGNPTLSSMQAPYTPSSNYEPPNLQEPSPSSSLADPQASQQRSNQLNAPTPIDMIGSFGHDFAQAGLASESYSYGGGGSAIDNAIILQQIDLGSMALPDELVGPWDLFPIGNFADLFDPNHLADAGNAGQM